MGPTPRDHLNWLRVPASYEAALLPKISRMKYRRQRRQSVFVPRGFWLFSVLPRPQMDKAALRHLETAALTQGHHSAPSLTRVLILMDNRVHFSFMNRLHLFTHKRVRRNTTNSFKRSRNVSLWERGSGHAVDVLLFINHITRRARGSRSPEKRIAQNTERTCFPGSARLTRLISPSRNLQHLTSLK